MKKYLDIFLFTVLFFLIFSYFFGDPQEVSQKSGMYFELSTASESVPAELLFDIDNYTGENVSFDMCQDIELRYAGDKLHFPEELCVVKEIVSGSSITIDLSEYYTLFQEEGSYTFTYTYGDKQYIQSLDVSYRGSLGKLFIALFYAPTYNLLAYLIHVFHNSLGLAIIAVTIIIRILLLFPQHKMLVSQRKMQAIQPKIKALQEKFKGKQQEMGMELMKLYKKEGVNPMGSCGLLLIQMPILIVIYNIILTINSSANEFYLYSFLPEFHTSQIQYNFLGIELLQAGGVVGFILAIVVALIQYIQIKLSLMHKPVPFTSGKDIVLEKKKGASDYNSFMPDPELMNKFMLYGMPAMVAVFTFSFAAGVGLYWGISTLFAIFQQLFVNKIVKK